MAWVVRAFCVACRTRTVRSPGSRRTIGMVSRLVSSKDHSPSYIMTSGINQPVFFLSLSARVGSPVRATCQREGREPSLGRLKGRLEDQSIIRRARFDKRYYFSLRRSSEWGIRMQDHRIVSSTGPQRRHLPASESSGSSVNFRVSSARLPTVFLGRENDHAHRETGKVTGKPVYTVWPSAVVSKGD